MKTIYLIRHSYAVKQFKGQDYDRALKTKGIQVAEFIGQQLKSQQIMPDFILTSAAIRTLETAKILAKELNVNDDNILAKKSLYGANETDILSEVNGLNNAYRTVFVVGHNPTISGAVSYLSGEPPVMLSPGSVVGITFDADQWTEVSFNSGNLLNQFFPRSFQELAFIID